MRGSSSAGLRLLNGPWPWVLMGLGLVTIGVVLIVNLRSLEDTTQLAASVTELRAISDDMIDAALSPAAAGGGPDALARMRQDFADSAAALEPSLATLLGPQTAAEQVVALDDAGSRFAASVQRAVERDGSLSDSGLTSAFLSLARQLDALVQLIAREGQVAFSAVRVDVTRGFMGLTGAGALAALALAWARRRAGHRDEELRHALVDLRAAHAQTRASEERFRALVVNAKDSIFVVDPNGAIRYASPSAIRMSGDVSGGNIVELLHPDERERLAKLIERLRRLPAETQSIDLRLRHRSGGWRQLETVATNLLGNANVRGIVLNARDVTERTALERKLEYQALYDELTGLPNRALFSDRLANALAAAEQEGHTAAVMFIDVDRFKPINDTFGHDVGDQLLVDLAKRLQRVLPRSETIARYGGDEFTVLITRCLDEETAAAYAQRMIDALADPITIERREIFVTLSIGVALSSGAHASVQTVLRDADAALYRAKASGRSRYALFDHAQDLFSPEQLQLQSDLRRVVEREQLRIFYQPVVSLDTGELVGAEALVRWQHPEMGLLPPDRFVAMAEDLGAISAIGEWVFGEACRQLQVWRSVHPDCCPNGVSVNVSARELREPDFVQQVRAALEATHLNPADLELEITESLLMADVPNAVSMLQQVGSSGVRLAIDDFGTGYSSLSYLTRMPVHTLKIDQSFVHDLDRNGQAPSVVRAIVALAHALGLQVTAEGIETYAQWLQLRELGCALGQGFYFARPLEADAMTTLIGAGWRADLGPQRRVA